MQPKYVPFILLMLTVVFGGFSCERSDIQEPRAAEEARVLAEWRHEISDVAEGGADAPVAATIAVNIKGTKTSFLRDICSEQGLEVIGVEYFIRNVSTGVLRFRADPKTDCEKTYLDLVGSRFAENRGSNRSPDLGSFQAQTSESIRGLRVRASPATLLRLWQTKREIRAVRLFHDGVPMDIPWPDQPISNAFETSP